MYGDPTRLRQILINLLTNSVKNTDHGEISLTADVINKTNENIKLKVSVTDTGRGIPEEKLKLLFKPYTQVKNKQGTEKEGSGLGLMITKQIVELMRGRIELHSDEGIGTTVEFTVILDVSAVKMPKFKSEEEAVEEEKPTKREIPIPAKSPVEKSIAMEHDSEVETVREKSQNIVDREKQKRAEAARKIEQEQPHIEERPKPRRPASLDEALKPDLPSRPSKRPKPEDVFSFEDTRKPGKPPIEEETPVYDDTEELEDAPVMDDSSDLDESAVMEDTPIPDEFQMDEEIPMAEEESIDEEFPVEEELPVDDEIPMPKHKPPRVPEKEETTKLEDIIELEDGITLTEANALEEEIKVPDPSPPPKPDETPLVDQIPEYDDLPDINMPVRTHAKKNGKKILLVEDNPISQKVETKILLEFGYDVVTVSNGKEAIRAVETDNFNIILMDLQMPDMDGIAATKKIRSLGPPMNRVPIIAVTAHSSMKDRETCLASGMDDYIAKPININFLRMTIEQWINREHYD
jgi:CheY-like chemotaxis protein/anti-sigma regulatory factor (Ser/Thr protein kinase)